MTLRLRETTSRQRIVRQFVLVAGVLLEIVGVMPEEIDGLLRFAERLHAVLADLERERRRDLVDALFHDVGDATQQPRALRDRRGAPGQEMHVAQPAWQLRVGGAGDANSPRRRSLSIGLTRDA